MFVLGLQGSPRKNGNTDILLGAFMAQAEKAGAMAQTIQVAKAGIAPCKGCGYCETHGTCVIADDPMSTNIYGLMRRADVVVAASPVFFYGISAQLKGLIDRSQTLWSRKYVYKLKDPLATTRQGILLSVGASRGRQLFDGIHLTAKYFFDGINAQFNHALTYRGVEAKGDIRQRPNWTDDIDAAVQKIVLPLAGRKRILFVSQNGTLLAPMASAMAQLRYADHICAQWGAAVPAPHLNTEMMQAMQSNGVDMAYQFPRHMDQVRKAFAPDLIVSMGRQAIGDLHGPTKAVHWSLDPTPAPDANAIDQLHQNITRKMDRLLQHLH